MKYSRHWHARPGRVTGPARPGRARAGLTELARRPGMQRASKIRTLEKP
jgi:hypothetical protein